MGHTDEDDIPFKEGAKPLAHPDWYELSLGDKQNLAQAAYQATGAILPRELSDFDGLKSCLNKMGIRGKNAVHMDELMLILETAQYGEKFPSPSIPDTHPDDAEDAAELKEQLRELRQRHKKVADTAHSQHQRAGRAEAALPAGREKMAVLDTDVIRYADVVWIRTNAIPHKMYYKIMDAARKWKIPVKYFLYASVRKCAEQVVPEETHA